MTTIVSDVAALATPVDALEIHEKVGIVMEDRCARCHQESVASEMNGGFDFATELAFLAEDEDYIEPEDPEASPLFEHLVGDEDTMPPSPRDRLSEDEIEWVRVWIEEGAPSAQ